MQFNHFKIAHSHKNLKLDTLGGGVKFTTKNMD